MHRSSAPISPLAPFDFAKSLRFLEGFSPTEGEQAIETGPSGRPPGSAPRRSSSRSTQRTVPPSSRPSSGSPCGTSSPIDDAVAAATIERVGRFLSVDDDVAAFYEGAVGDHMLAPHVERLFGLHQVRFLTPFENAC
ncbi:MAG: hypothetical protein ACRDH7_16395 [Actinomycetota bacterium]